MPLSGIAPARGRVVVAAAVHQEGVIGIVPRGWRPFSLRRHVCPPPGADVRPVLRLRSRHQEQPDRLAGGVEDGDTLGRVRLLAIVDFDLLDVRILV